MNAQALEHWAYIYFSMALSYSDYRYEVFDITCNGVWFNNHNVKPDNIAEFDFEYALGMYPNGGYEFRVKFVYREQEQQNTEASAVVSVQTVFKIYPLKEMNSKYPEPIALMPCLEKTIEYARAFLLTESKQVLKTRVILQQPIEAEIIKRVGSYLDNLN